MYRTTFSEVSTLRPGWLFNTSFDCLAHVFTVYLPLYCTVSGAATRKLPYGRREKRGRKNVGSVLFPLAATVWSPPPRGRCVFSITKLTNEKKTYSSKLWAREPHFFCLGCRVNLDNDHADGNIKLQQRTRQQWSGWRRLQGAHARRQSRYCP